MKKYHFTRKANHNHFKECLLTPVLLLLVGILGVFALLYTVAKDTNLLRPLNKEKFSLKTTSEAVDDKKKCESTDYTGCDNEKNFFQWKDDGLRK